MDIQPCGSFRNYGSQHEMVGQATIAGVMFLVMPWYFRIAVGNYNDYCNVKTLLDEMIAS